MQWLKAEKCGAEPQYGGREDLNSDSTTQQLHLFLLRSSRARPAALYLPCPSRPKCLPLPTTYSSLPSPIFLHLRLAGSIRSRSYSERLNTLKRRSSSQITPGVFLLIYSILYSLHISPQPSRNLSTFFKSPRWLPYHLRITIR